MTVKPRIGIIGTGYVGLVSGACFADLDFQVSCLDVVSEKVELINKAIPPIFENGLKELLLSVVTERKLLAATLNRQEMFDNSDLLFICLPTPSSEDGSIDLSFIENETKELAKLLKESKDYKTFVVKSTVIPGTTSGVVRKTLEEISGKIAGQDFGLAMNPEFLMEGLAISNFTKPDRIVIGAVDDTSFEHVKQLYTSFDCEILKTTTSEAEMIKYATNSFLATKVSFINEIANISEGLGINVGQVARGIGLDDRISPRFLRAGVGFGGSCFPKDVKALYAVSKQLNVESQVLKAALQANELQPQRAVDLLAQMTEIKGKVIALLGLAFKPETDDMREAPSIRISQRLHDMGATVRGYDPIAKETAQRSIPFITHCGSIQEAINGADGVIIVTEWNEFVELKPQDFSDMRTKVIVDGRRIYNPEVFTGSGFKIKIIGQ